MDIELSDLKAIFFKEIEHLEALGYETIEIPVDTYWNIPQDQRYDPYHEPGHLDLGQLSDDWQMLQNRCIGKREPLAYDLVWFSTICELSVNILWDDPNLWIPGPGRVFSVLIRLPGNEP